MGKKKRSFARSEFFDTNFLSEGNTIASRAHQCHPHGNTMVYKTHTLALYASGTFHGVAPIPGAIHLNLGPQEVWTTPLVQQKHITLPSLSAYEHAYAEIALAWEDGSIPAVGKRFWCCLIQDCLAHARNTAQPLSLLVFCMGGHGRTGTALAILLGLLGIKNPCEHVWSHYCNNAIETQEQERYIAQILG